MKVRLWLGGMIFAIGLPLLLIGILIYADARSFLADSTTTTGVVTSVEERGRRMGTSYQPTIRFVTSEGQEVQFASSAGDFEDRIGETVTVHYDPQDPAHAEIDQFFQIWGLSPIFLGIGGVFTVIGTGIVGSILHTRISRNRMMAHGQMIFTQFKGTEQNTRIQVYHQHPYQIVSEWVDPLTGQLHRFRSENLWSNPEGKIPSNEIQVYVDPKNPKRYFMDTSFLAT